VTLASLTGPVPGLSSSLDAGSRYVHTGSGSRALSGRDQLSVPRGHSCLGARSRESASTTLSHLASRTTYSAAATYRDAVTQAAALCAVQVDHRGYGTVMFGSPQDMEDAVRKLDGSEMRNTRGSCDLRLRPLASRGRCDSYVQQACACGVVHVRACTGAAWPCASLVALPCALSDPYAWLRCRSPPPQRDSYRENRREPERESYREPYREERERY
jgi:hypothetical protein